jgi:hypothetical protein
MLGIEAPTLRAPEPEGAPRRARLRREEWVRSLDQVRFRDVAVLILAVLTIFGYVDIGPHGRIVPGHINWHKTDFTVYTAAGAAFFDGRDPYAVTNPRGWFYLYPPLFAILVSPLTAFNTETQVLTWYVISIAMGFGCYSEARRLWRLTARATTNPDSVSVRFSRWVGLCGFAAAIIPALDCLQRGQLGIAILFLLMLGLRLSIERRTPMSQALAGIVLALPAAVKLVPILPVGSLVSQRGLAAFFPAYGRRRLAGPAALAIGVAFGGFLFLFAIPSAFVGWNNNLSYLRRWTDRVVSNDRLGSSANFDVHSPRNQSLANAVFLLGEQHRSDKAREPIDRAARDQAPRIGNRSVVVVIAAALAILMFVELVIGRRDDPDASVANFGLACTATLLVSPLAWGHYYMMMLPAALFVPLWLAHRGWVRLGMIAAAAPALFTWIHYLFLRQVGPLGLLGLSTTAWFFAVCGAIAFVEFNAPGEQRPSRRPPSRFRLVGALAGASQDASIAVGRER